MRYRKGRPPGEVLAGLESLQERFEALAPKIDKFLTKLKDVSFVHFLLSGWQRRELLRGVRLLCRAVGGISVIHFRVRYFSASSDPAERSHDQKAEVQ